MVGLCKNDELFLLSTDYILQTVSEDKKQGEPVIKEEEEEEELAMRLASMKPPKRACTP
jgi:hypothetical protein